MSINAAFTHNRRLIEPGHGSLCKECRNFRRGRKCAVADKRPELVQTGIPKVVTAIFCTHLNRPDERSWDEPFRPHLP